MINIYRTVIIDENGKEVLLQEPLYSASSLAKTADAKIVELKQLVEREAAIQFEKLYVTEVEGKSYFNINNVSGLLSYKLDKNSCCTNNVYSI